MKQIVTIAFILLLSSGGWAQKQQQENSDSTTNLESEITQIKNELVQLNKELQLVQKNNNIEETELKDFFYDKYGKWFTIWAFLGTIIGFILSFSVISIMVNKLIKSQTMKYLENNEWFEALKVKINKQLDQNRLKLNMKIGVLSNGEEAEMSTFLKENEFLNVTHFRFSSNIETDSSIFKNDFEVLIINNQNNQFDFKTIKIKSGANVPDKNTPINDFIDLIKNEYPTLAVFYFNDTGDNLPKELNKGLISSFTNSYASTYHNLLDLMRYKYLVIDKKEL